MFDTDVQVSEKPYCLVTKQLLSVSNPYYFGYQTLAVLFSGSNLAKVEPSSATVASTSSWSTMTRWTRTSSQCSAKASAQAWANITKLLWFHLFLENWIINQILMWTLPFIIIVCCMWLRLFSNRARISTTQLMAEIRISDTQVVSGLQTVKILKIYSSLDHYIYKINQNGLV